MCFTDSVQYWGHKYNTAATTDIEIEDRDREFSKVGRSCRQITHKAVGELIYTTPSSRAPSCSSTHTTNPPPELDIKIMYYGYDYII